MTQAPTLETAAAQRSGSVQPAAVASSGQPSHTVARSKLPAGCLRSENARLQQAAFHRDECGDCIETCLAGLMILTSLLFAASLMYQPGISTGIVQFLRAGIGFLAAATGVSAFLSICLATFHFLQLRQL